MPDPDDIRQKKILDRPIDLTEETARKLIDRIDRTGALRPVHRIRSNEVLSALLGTIGIALFIVGVERAAEDIPVISNPYGSIAVGVVLLLATGALIARLRTH